MLPQRRSGALGAGRPAIIDEVPAGRLYKDGSLLIAAEARTVADRRRLSFSGIVSVALALNDKGELLADPEVELIGIPETDRRRRVDGRDRLRRRGRDLRQLPKPRRRDPDAVGEAIRRAVRAAVAQHWRKKPNVTVHVLIV